MANIIKNCDFNILQWNAKSIIHKKLEFSKYCYNFDIILISETWLSAEKSFILNGYDTVRKDRLNRSGGGVLILVKKPIKYKRIDIKEDCGKKIEACAIEVTIGGEPVILVSCYRPPSALNLTVREWEKFLGQFGIKAIFCGDFNTHNTSWGSSHICPSGRNLEEALESSEYTLLNDGSLTFHSAAYHSNSVIDLTIVPSSLALDYFWRVNEDSWGSDHFPIIIQTRLKLDNIKTRRKPPNLYSSKINWNLFQTTLDSEIKNSSFSEVICSDLDIEVIYSSFLGIIEKTLEITNPKPSKKRSDCPNDTLQKSNQPSCIWWSEECDKLVRLRKAALAKFNFTGLHRDFVSFKKAEAKARIVIKRTKKESFQNFCSNLRKDSKPTQIWNTIKKFKSRWNRTENDGEFDPLKEHRIEEQLKNICPPWVPLEPFKFEDTTDTHFLDTPFSMLELDMALAFVNTKSSPGLDRIDYLILKKLTSLGNECLLHVYNRILSSGRTPPQWNRYSVFFIPKGDKTKFRPISLASCICKTMERMVNNRLNWWLEFYGKLPNSQYGFRREKACVDNLSILYSEILAAFQKNSGIAAAFLDIKGAYDNVLVDILQQKLQKIGIPTKTRQFIFNLTYAREIVCKFDRLDEVLWTYKGLPQGSVLSPLLYTCYVTEMDDLGSPSCGILQYADDVCIYSSANSLDLRLYDLERKLEKGVEILNSLGLELSKEKTKLCIFSDKDKDLKQPVKIGNRTTYRKVSRHIKISGIEINSSTVIRFLGLNFQSDLNWTAQIKHIEKNCAHSLRTIKCLARTWWGGDPRLLLIFCKALILSRIEYGGFLFHNLSNDLSSRVDKILRNALRVAMGYRMSTPINIIHEESKVPPLFLRMQYLGKGFLSRVFTKSNHPLIEILERTKDLIDAPTNNIRTFKHIPFIKAYESVEKFAHLLASDYIPLSLSCDFEVLLYSPEVNLDDGFPLQLSNSAARDFSKIFGQELQTTTCLFTDGSKLEDAPFTGFAITSLDGGICKQYRAANLLSSFCIEGMAILEAVRLAGDLGCTPCTIFSDSMSVLLAVAGKFDPSHSSFVILEIKKELKNLKDKGEICQLIWIPSHKGIIGNEKADMLAREAIRVGRDTQIGVPLKELKNLWKKEMFENLQNWCREEGILKGTNYCNNFLLKSQRTWFHKYNISRRTVTSLNRLRSGHTSLKESLFRFRMIDSPLCALCGVEETPDHVFWSCYKFEKQRKVLNDILIGTRGFLPHSVGYLLATIDEDIIYAIDEFINGIKIDI